MAKTKELIDKIEMNEGGLHNSLEWLTEGKTHGLHTEQLSEVVRYLLKKVIEMEQRLDQNSSHLE